MVMEAYAVRDGVQLAYELGYRKVIIETDAKLVVDQWKTPRIDRSEIYTTINEIQELCGNFEEFHLIYTAREANELAHLCAKHYSASRRRCLWINYIPTFLAACVR